jgi:hypothetical protein
MQNAKRHGACITRLLKLIILFVSLNYLASAAEAGERYAVIISGAAGGERYAAQQKKWTADLSSALATGFGFPDSNVAVLSEEATGTSRATSENVRRLLGDLRRHLTRDDTLLLVLFGHGTFDGADAKFNLVGPDLTAFEWKGLLDGIVGRVVIANTTEASFPFLEELSQRGRVVITATDSAAQRFATVFPEYFIRALVDLSGDFDKNGRVSVWEAFTSASAGVRQYYEQKGQLSTEHPLLDDDGDRVGREAETPGGDGAVARTIYLDPEPGSTSTDAAVAALERQRLTLQTEIEELKARKPSMTDEQYQAELERLLLQLARVTRRIKDRS